GFDWGWYYAFQQVGDQTVEPLSQAYVSGRLQRDRLAGLFAWVAPPALLERRLQQLAATDMRAVIHYENGARAFHARLRAFYYPQLYGNDAFNPERYSDLPRFVPTR
ncbi:MAG: DUF3526 domain-containing protein, partial [Pseudomonadota bacterium]